MPVYLRRPLRALSQAEFREISFEVMRHVFAIHNEIGRFFDERIYKCELAHRMPEVRLEEPIEVAFGSFTKQLLIDAVAADGGLFEFKAVESLTGQHRAQLLQYLMLADVAHGKLINVRPRDVEHEFVNTHWERAQRTGFSIQSSRWNGSIPGAAGLYDLAIPLLRDLGTGLQIPLYEEIIAHCFGGLAEVEHDVPVIVNGHLAGYQRFRLIAPGVALKITAFDEPCGYFEVHARRMMTHCGLRAIAWLNIGLQEVTFTTLE